MLYSGCLKIFCRVIYFKQTLEIVRYFWAQFFVINRLAMAQLTPFPTYDVSRPRGVLTPLIIIKPQHF